MLSAIRSVPSPPPGYIKKPAPKVVDYVKAPNLRVLATAAYRLQKCGGVTKKKSKNTTKSKVRVVYELYPPHYVKKNERWFCQFIKNIDDNTFLGRWYLANSTTVLDTMYAKPVVFEWCTVRW